MMSIFLDVLWQENSKKNKEYKTDVLEPCSALFWSSVDTTTSISDWSSETLTLSENTSYVPLLLTALLHWRLVLFSASCSGSLAVRLKFQGHYDQRSQWKRRGLKLLQFIYTIYPNILILYAFISAKERRQFLKLLSL